MWWIPRGFCILESKSLKVSCNVLGLEAFLTFRCWILVWPWLRLVLGIVLKRLITLISLHPGLDKFPKQRSTKHAHKTKDRVTRTQLKTRGGTRHVNLVANPVICHEWGKERELFTTSGTYPWPFVIQIIQVMVVTVKLSKWRLQLNQEKPLVQYLPC